MARVSTSHVERQNLAMRMHMRRFARRTNALSKEVDNHANAVALHCEIHDFARLHGKARVTSAMQGGLTDRLWDVSNIVALVEDAGAPAAKRVTHEKRDANVAD